MPSVEKPNPIKIQVEGENKIVFRDDLSLGAQSLIGTVAMGSDIKTAAKGNRIELIAADAKFNLYIGAETTARVSINPANSSLLLLTNPASSGKDGLILTNSAGIALTINNNNVAASYALNIAHAGVKVGINYTGSADLDDSAGKEAHLYFVKTGTGGGRVAYFRNEGTGIGMYIENNVGSVGSTVALQIQHYGTGSAIQLVAGDMDLGGCRLINLKTKTSAPSAAELGAHGLMYDTTNKKLYFNNGGTVESVQFA